MSVITCPRVDAKGVTCGGTIEDGICERCGRPLRAGTLVSAGTGAVAGPAATQATRSTGTVGTTGTGTRPGGRTSRRHTRGSTSRRQALGGGLVSLPPMPSQDPLLLVMADPAVPGAKRRCPSCGGRVNRAKGYCPACSAAYDFEPKLRGGDVVAGKYEVKGPIAFGGMGWVYLGWDMVLSRWVVLKGLLNTHDAEALAAAMAERQFLADVKHGRIVGIFDFVSQGSEGYMVLEYVGGRTLESLRDARGPLPPEEAIAYILGVLPAFSYLHARGYVYCDFKPGNLMLEGDDVKLIDMGAVRRIGDPDGAVFGTDGYSAKEAGDDPTAVSDLYTIGRTLAVLLMDFLWKTSTDPDPVTGRSTTTRRMLSTYVHALPTPSEQKVLADHESLHRFLVRSTHEDPDQRFQTADEMEAQLFGVLRQVVARKTGPKPADSKAFLGDNLVDGADRLGASAPLARLLPTLRLDMDDPAAGEVASAATVTDPRQRIELLAGLCRKRPASIEARLRMIDAFIAADRVAEAKPLAAALLREDEFEWRAHWYTGKALLAQGDASRALDAFDRVYFEMPGELAPILAIAFAAEAAGDAETAARRYARVVETDPSYASACFGLARTRTALGDEAGAAAALEVVPAAHGLRNEAQVALAGLLLARMEASVERGRPAGAQPSLVEGAGRVVAGLHAGPDRTHAEARLFAAAAAMLGMRLLDPSPTQEIVGVPLHVEALRRAGERACRRAARAAPDASARERFVDRANAIRPSSLF